MDNSDLVSTRPAAPAKAWPPHITVAAIVQKGDKFLMVEEIESNNRVINQPAGHLDPGETIFEAVVRETLEETAWRVELQHLVGLYHYLSPNNQTTYHRVCFAAKPIEDTGAALDPDIVQASWMRLTDIKAANLRSPLVILCIEDYLAGQMAPLSFLKHL